MPTPRELTAHCGLSLRFPPHALKQVRDALEACGMSPDGREISFYRMEYDEHTRAVTPVE